MPRLRFMLAGLSLLGGLVIPGCVHRRHVFYPNERPQADSGVRVRAPFVDVQVQGDHDDDDLDDED